MAVIARQGTLEECLKVVEQIKEFTPGESVESMAARLEGKESLILVAEEAGELLGFKIGYEMSPTCFYSWFGGVSPNARNKGVAQKLLDMQETWVMEQGYSELRVKSRNKFPSMLRLLLRNGYLIENVEKKPDILESRIHFVKTLKM